MIPSSVSEAQAEENDLTNDSICLMRKFSGPRDTRKEYTAKLYGNATVMQPANVTLGIELHVSLLTLALE